MSCCDVVVVCDYDYVGDGIDGLGDEIRKEVRRNGIFLEYHKTGKLTPFHSQANTTYYHVMYLSCMAWVQFVELNVEDDCVTTNFFGFSVVPLEFCGMPLHCMQFFLCTMHVCMYIFCMIIHLSCLPDDVLFHSSVNETQNMNA